MKKTFFIIIFLVVFSLISCSSKTDQGPATEENQETSKTPVQKKILYSQRTQGGKNAINVIEEISFFFQGKL